MSKKAKSGDDGTLHIPPRQPLVPLAALALLVRVPHKPSATRAFTAAEAAEAHRYAQRCGVACESLPLPGAQWWLDAADDTCTTIEDQQGLHR